MKVGETKLITDVSGTEYRVYRFANSILATDITNAGKRGKVCDKYSFYSCFNDDQNNTRFDQFEYHFKNEKSAYQTFKDFEGNGIGISLEHTPEKGVRVPPRDFENVVIDNGSVSLEAKFDTFVIRDLKDKNNMPIIISTSDTPKSHVKKFHKLASSGKLDNKEFTEIAEEMRRLDIRFHQYCRMD